MRLCCWYFCFPSVFLLSFFTKKAHAPSRLVSPTILLIFFFSEIVFWLAKRGWSLGVIFVFPHQQKIFPSGIFFFSESGYTSSPWYIFLLSVALHSRLNPFSSSQRRFYSKAMLLLRKKKTVSRSLLRENLKLIQGGLAIDHSRLHFETRERNLISKHRGTNRYNFGQTHW